MAYRVKTLFKDGSTNGPLSDVVAASSPRYGDTIFVSRHGQDVPVRVTAVWTPSPAASRGGKMDGLVMVEAREI